METLKIILLCLIFVSFSFAQTGGDFLKFKARIGFDDEKERIAAKQFSADGMKLTLIGLKNIQVWDVPTAKLIESHAHEIVELDKFFGMSYQISPDGSKVITLDSIGRDGSKKTDRVNAYAYDVQTGKRIAVLERPETSVRFAFWSANGETVVTFSGLLNQKRTEISFWNGADLSFRKSINIEGYTWHHLSPVGERLYVGNGGQIKFLGLPAGPSNGNVIRVYNTRTAAIEKELKANGADFDVDVFHTVVSPDGRFIATSKEKNIIVWDTAGEDVQPIYELAPRDPKGQIFIEGFSDNGEYLYAVQKKVNEYYDAKSGRLAADVPQLTKLRRESKHIVPTKSNFPFPYVLLGVGYRREKSVLQTPDGRYAVTLPCKQTEVIDLTTAKTLYAIKGDCNGDGNDNLIYGILLPNTYYYSNDVYRLSPGGKLLINFRSNRFVVRDLKTGAILQTVERKRDENLMKVPKGNLEWDVKGRYALTVAEDKKSMLIWEINEN